MTDSPHLPRRLVAVLYADVAGYSRLTAADEDATHQRLSSYLDLFAATVKAHGGKVMHYAGDAVLARFDAVVDAVSCAIDVQRELALRNAGLSQDQRIDFRIGVNLGDVIEDRGDVYGDGVNVAARLEALAVPGEICVAEAVRTALGNRPELEFEDLGEQRLKNIDHPVRAYRLRVPAEAVWHHEPVSLLRRLARGARSRPGPVAAGVLAAALILVSVNAYLGDRRTGTVPGPGPTVPAAKNSVAVLPFADASAAGENAEFLALGLHDELLTLLSRIHGLKVISRTSSARYRSSEKSLGQIGRELGVSRILEGSVQRAGNRIRVNVQLIDASSDQHIWAERYDREISPDSLFEIQGDVAATIARTMRSALSAQEQRDLARVPTDSLEAYQAYLLGKHRMIARTSKGIAEAADYFREAIELDPAFAPAYVGLADTFMLESEYGGLSRSEMTAKATPLLERALALDERLAAAYTTMGAVRSKSADFSGAEAAFQRAIEIDPSNSTAFHWYGDVLLVNKSRPEAALPLLRRALELDPLSPAVIATLGQVLEALGQFDDALKQYMKIIEVEPDSPMGYLMVGHFERFVNGRLDEAARWYHESIARDPGNSTVQATLGLCYLDLGDAGKAAAWIYRAVDQGRGQHWPMGAAMRLALWEHRDADVRNMADRLWDISPQANDPLLGRVHLGDYREIVDLHADRYPDLSCSGEAHVSRQVLFQAINLSLARQETGDGECATRLLSGALDVMSRMPRLGRLGYGIADVEVLSRLGRTDAALAALRQAIDSGWRSNWWLQGERNPHLAALRSNPAFMSMADEIRDDVAVQLARVREMADSGKLASEP